MKSLRILSQYFYSAFVMISYGQSVYIDCMTLKISVAKLFWYSKIFDKVKGSSAVEAIL